MKKFLLTILSLIAMHAGWAQCTASFTNVAAPFGNSLLTYGFTNTSTSTYGYPQYYSLYTMSYGDGAMSYGSYIPSHTYNTTGSYNAYLAMQVVDSISGNVVCLDTFFTAVSVNYTACATLMDYTDLGNGTFNFFATNPAGTPGMTYAWDFGDGNTSTLQNPSHSYAGNGNYTVTLVATGGGCSYTNSLGITNGGINCSGLSTNFTYSQVNNTVSFSDMSSPGNSPSVVMHSYWNFGDGNTSTATNPSNTYGSYGSYWVTLHMQWEDTFSNTYCTDSVMQMITVGTPPPPVYDISGNVYYDSTIYGSVPIMVYLIQFDSAAGTLTAVDSQFTTPYYFSNYSFINPAPGTYLVKAVPVGQTIGGSGLVPTYHDSSLYWSAAPMIYCTNFNSYQANIWMQNGTVTSGPGFVGGNISQGANKGTTNGVPGIVVYLRNSTNDLIASSVTDGNGDYSFSNLPSGIYNVYPEDMGLATTPSGNLTVYSSGQTSVTGVDFVRNSTSIVPVTTSVGEVKGSNVFALYPNPAQNSVTLTTKAAAEVTVTNATGAKVLQIKVKGGSEQLSLSNLPVGLYMVKVQSGAAVQTSKLLIQR